jgi:hypothetical protein
MVRNMTFVLTKIQEPLIFFLCWYRLVYKIENEKGQQEKRLWRSLDQSIPDFSSTEHITNEDESESEEMEGFF